MGNAIVDVVPSNSGGTPTKYDIAPALPTGLSFDQSTGKITGTTTALQAATTYTVTAHNAAGDSTATFTLAVVVAPASITLSHVYEDVSAGSAIVGFTAANVGGAVTSYSISPTPNNGTLSFDSNTGTLSGTTANVQAATTYTVTATNWIWSYIVCYLHLDCAHSSGSSKYLTRARS
jgi:hypothetical protein